MEAVADTPLYFSELAPIKTRSAFSEDCAVTLENVQQLLAEYHGPEWARCQVEHDGSRCNQEFQNGWLARRQDGKEGLIGRDCAEKYFNASETFRAERRRLTRDIRIESHFVVLSEILADKPGFAARLRNAAERLRVVSDAIKGLREALPREVVGTLDGMVKTRSATVFVEVQYIEMDENGEEKSSWRRRDIGNILGLTAWDGSLVRHAFEVPRLAARALNEVVVSRDQREGDLRTWREALEAFPACEGDAAKIERAAEEIQRSDSIALLCNLVSDHAKQRSIVRLLLRLRGEVTPKDYRVQNVLNEIHAQVRNRFGGRNFRPAH